jgi:hypothetical protein
VKPYNAHVVTAAVDPVNRRSAQQGRSRNSRRQRGGRSAGGPRGGGEAAALAPATGGRGGTVPYRRRGGSGPLAGCWRQGTSRGTVHAPSAGRQGRNALDTARGGERGPERSESGTGSTVCDEEECV